MSHNSRKFGPMPWNHPSIGRKCVACNIPFKADDYTTPIPLGPGADPEAQRRCREGKSFNSVAVEVHWACTTGE